MPHLDSDDDIERREEPHAPLPHPDAPCDYADCQHPWVRKIAGRFMCEKHVSLWKSVVLPSPR